MQMNQERIQFLCEMKMTPMDLLQHCTLINKNVQFDSEKAIELSLVFKAQTVKGYPVQTFVASGKTFAILSSDLRSSNDQPLFSCLDLEGLTAVTVSERLRFLQEYTTKKEDPSHAPSRLQLERELAEVAKNRQTTLRFHWNGSEEQAGVRVFAQSLVASLSEVIESISQDDIGRQAFLELDGIRLEPDVASVLAAQREGRTLVIRFGPDRGGRSCDARELKSKLESVL